MASKTTAISSPLRLLFGAGAGGNGESGAGIGVAGGEGGADDDNTVGSVGVVEPGVSCCFCAYAGVLIDGG